jgi:Holliday junction resolvase
MFMEQKQESFEIKLKKGEIGERIIREYLESNGWIVYIPFTKNKAHYFDMLATMKKEKAIAIDVKTKARLNKWNAQGIDKTHYKQYMEFINNHNVPFYLCFIDDKSGDVHVAELEKLNNPINVNDKIIAWEVSQMKLLMNIGKELVNELSMYDQRNYKYEPSIS